MDTLTNIQNTSAHLNGVASHASSSMSGTGANAATKMPSRTKSKHSLRDIVRICATAYGASLIMTGVMVPFVSSVVMVGLYLALPNVSLSFWPLLQLDSSSKWYVLGYSSLLSVYMWLIAALLCCPFTTAKVANASSYGLLRGRLCQLKAILGIEGADREFMRLQEKFGDIQTAVDKIKVIRSNDTANAGGYCNQTARTDALACYIDISNMLRQSPAGLPWVFGTGYINAWSLLHHAEEALIESECTPEVIRGAMHDYLAIQGSAIKGRDGLLDKLIQAVSVLQPAAGVYFKEHQPDKNSAVLNQLAEGIKDKAIKQFMSQYGLAEATIKAGPDAESTARVALREVRSTLNDFRDKSLEGIVRARNRLLGSIALTGAVTHILLCIAILTSDIPDSTHPAKALIAATAFYLVGAVTGLFARFYNESLGGTAVDDFGFSIARLVATPLLSGLAGIGGVLVTVMLATLGGSAIGNTMQPSIALESIFHIDPRLLFAAAIFGLTPNLLIKGLQDKANKFESDIEQEEGSARA